MKREPTNVAIRHDLQRRIREIAAIQKCRFADVIERMILAAIDREETKAAKSYRESVGVDMDRNATFPAKASTPGRFPGEKYFCSECGHAYTCGACKAQGRIPSG